MAWAPSSSRVYRRLDYLRISSIHLSILLDISFKAASISAVLVSLKVPPVLAVTLFSTSSSVDFVEEKSWDATFEELIERVEGVVGVYIVKKLNN